MLGHVRPPLWTGVGSGTSSGTPKNFSAFRSGEDKKISVCLTDSLKEEMCAKTRIFGRFQGPQIIFARRSRGVGHTHSFNNLPLPGGGGRAAQPLLCCPPFLFFLRNSCFCFIFGFLGPLVLRQMFVFCVENGYQFRVLKNSLFFGGLEVFQVRQ